MVRPQSFIHGSGPWSLLVCYNSAHPINVYVSSSEHDRPTNPTWSPAGSLLAFTAGDSIYIWKPTAEAHAPAGPVEAKASDF